MNKTSPATALVAAGSKLAKKIRPNTKKNVPLHINTVANEMALKVVLERLKNGEYHNSSAAMRKDHENEIKLHIDALMK